MRIYIQMHFSRETGPNVLFYFSKENHSEIAEEEKSREIIDYEIFMTMIDHIGHDKRGRKFLSEMKKEIS